MSGDPIEDVYARVYYIARDLVNLVTEMGELRNVPAKREAGKLEGDFYMPSRQYRHRKPPLPAEYDTRRQS